ncbi:hypothetical protein OQA88_4226 [Cercophora sp. LCS_1]
MAAVFESAAPPPRASTWPWRGRSRRNSLSEGPRSVSAPSSPISRPGRNSLSIMDTSKADQIRTEVAALAAAASPTANPRIMGRVGEREVGGADGAKYSRRSSTSNSRPPPAFYNVPYTHKNTYKRHSSAAAALHNSFVSYNEELLKPPSRFRNPTFAGPDPSQQITSQQLVPHVVMLPVTTQMPVAMYPQREQDFVKTTQRSSEKAQYITEPKVSLRQPYYPDIPLIAFIPTARPDYPYPGMEVPTLQARPRRMSTSSSVSSTGSTVSWSRESFGSRMRSPSVSTNRTSMDSMPPHSPGALAHAVPYCPVHHRPQAQGYPWQKPVPINPRRRARPGELFAALPGEVLEMILQELRSLHTSPGGNSCETCWMRDACSVALSGRKFLKYAREALYQHIHLLGDESPQMKKRTKLNYGARLTLLRRTLRADMHLAVIVRSLKPPALPQGVGALEYNDLVASVVMACPNLERLVGCYPSYNHEFQRLFHALSTRKKLKDMNWILDPTPRSNVVLQPQHMTRPNGHVRTPSDLQPRQAQGFLDFHVNWQNLTSLVVHCNPGATLTPNLLLGRTLRCLPSLQNLHLSHLPNTSFNDSSLLSLPPLKKLTLDHLPGLSTAGLSAFATRSNSSRLTTLTLIHINIETIPALARLLSNLTSLATFNLVQKYAPILPSDELIWLFPYLASTALRRLHWDIPYLPTRATTADSILAKSIQAGGFPALRFLRAPNDPEGIFQSLCCPTGRADLPTDRYRGTQTQTNHRHHQSLQNGHDGHSSGWHGGHSHIRRASAVPVNTSPTSPKDSSFTQDALLLPRENSNLYHARISAQARLEAAKRSPKFFFNVINEYNVVVDKFGAGAFMGTVGSPIKYVLTPDAGGTDEGGGLVGVQDMLGDCGEALVLGGKSEVKKGSKREKGGESEGEGTYTREGCCGRWNVSESMVGDRKDKERWWHAERGRWRGVALS